MISIQSRMNPTCHENRNHPRWIFTGVRIPNPLFHESGLTGEIEIALRDNEKILRPVETTKND